jgi:hypothetical protein
MPIELLVPVLIFLGGMFVSHIMSNAGVRILEQQRKR